MTEESYTDWLRRKHDALGISRATVAPVLEDVTGTSDGLAAAEELVVGHSSVVFDVPRADGNVIVRAKVADEPQYEAERWARVAAHAAGVPVPEILGIRHLPNGERWTSICVERKLRGRPLLEVMRKLGTDHPRSRRLTTRFGAVLARLNSVEPQGYGTLDGTGRGRSASYAEHVRESVGAATARLLDARPSFDLGIVRSGADLVLAEADLLSPPRPSLAHMDAGPDHCFVDGDEVVGLIDLEGVQGADPVFDVAWWDYWRSWGMAYCPTGELIAGYADEALLRPESLPERFGLARLVLGITTLDYWVAQDRGQQAEQAYAILEADLAAATDNRPRRDRQGTSAIGQLRRTPAQSPHLGEGRSERGIGR